ncbi:MAG: nitrilase-related carbon-nitrogen hydrolase [Ilumatobacter sp.]|uniref:nitrilase-related carbon-nitrogen hydrolase n=1 Tax=Ilumatobacter sp. TaxID=1967498 RepID=UPI0032981716
MIDRFDVIVSDTALDSPFRGDRTDERPLRVGAVQCAWHPDASAHEATLRAGVALAAAEGAEIVLLQELTLSPYFCVEPDVADALDCFAEDLEGGPTVALIRSLAVEHGIAVHASLFERGEPIASRGVGYNTAVCVDGTGALVAGTRKTHIPEFEYYHEDVYFEPGDTGCPVTEVSGARFAFPTCWDQWFPELARVMSLDGAEVIVYPTAIGSEPHRPGFDSQPMWHQMIAANGLANATFMVAVNRIGTEGPLTFYGSSFVSDPYGRTVVQAPRDRPAVLVAQLDLGQREDWLDFGLIYTRRPDAYARLAHHSDLGRPT